MRKKSIIISIIAILVILAAVIVFIAFKTGGGSGGEGENAVDVHIEGNSIVYDGPMAASGVETAKEIYTDNIDRLIINSQGGEINIGMDLGEWVYDKGLDVEIRNIAFSSAANYVFTAGKNKYLHKDSMVGWHGGVTQDNKNHPILSFLMKKYIEEGKARETEFFNKIGVDQESTVYGLRPEFDKYSEEEGYVGWTYSLSAMEKLGIKNVQLLDGAWEPTAEYKGKKIFTIDEI